MECSKFCDDRTKQEEVVKWYQCEPLQGCNWERTYRRAMFTLPDSIYEPVEIFINLSEYHFKNEIRVSDKHNVKWGKCGETIFLVQHKYDNEIPMKHFCEFFYHSGGQTSDEQLKSIPN